MEKELVCIACPIGCHLEVTLEDGVVTHVDGNTCKRGPEYAETECVNPTRSLTSTVLLRSAHHPVVSVKSAEPIPKGLLFECMKVINQVTLDVPVHIGDVVVEDILGTGVDIVATNEVAV